MNDGVAKYYRYFVSDRDGRYLGELTNDVTNDFEYVDEINTLGGDLTVELGRSIRNLISQPVYLLTEAGEYLADEDGNRLVGEATEAVNVGPGTQINHNNRISVYEYYGTLSNLMTEAGDYLTTEDGYHLLAENGALNGRRVFCGYISKWSVKEADTSGITVTAVPMSTDLDDMIFENYFWSYTRNITGTLAYTDVVAGTGVDTYAVAQTFQAPASGPYMRFMPYLKIPADAGLFGSVYLIVKLYTGNDPNGSRTLLHTNSVYLNVSDLAGVEGLFDLSVNGGPELTSGSWYHVEISTTSGRITSGSPPFQVGSTTGGYTPGSFWSRPGSSSTFTEDTSKDIFFEFDVLTDRQTRTTYTGWSLYDFVDQTLDIAVQRGGRVNPNNPSDGFTFVENPAVTVPEIVLNVNTYKDRLDSSVKAAPLGWHYRYDHTNNHIWFKPRHDTADHTLIAGVHLKSVDVDYDAEQIVNVVYFTGGPYPTDTDPPLYSRYEDAASIAAYGVRAQSISDYRITNPSSADIRGEYELLVGKDPVYHTTVAVLDRVYDVSTIFVGQTVGFSAFGTFVDSLVLQVMRKETYKGYVLLTLGALPPTERKRLTDLKQALDQMAVADNEASPT